ncbi:UNVERIFIED_CONTAM: hypothetical protein GTU68_065545 [Idotea baltica]|nr:hypothetical protein [Idotea baltica]
MLMLSIGRIMGATGILSGFLIPSKQDWGWRATALLGMVSGPLVIRLFTGEFPVIVIPVSIPMILLGGLLVGVGVSYGGGCTSGHGVCGMARLSVRSIVATLVFMACTFATVFVVRHVIGV